MMPLHADNMKGARHGFFTRHENRNDVARHLGLAPENILRCQQVHSPDVVTVASLWDDNNRPQADAMVTALRGVALGVITADCAPVLLVDPAAGVIGALHAGWRGALAGVVCRTIESMEKLGADRKKISAAIGPCIGPESYEVGPAFPDPFLLKNQENAGFFKKGEKNGTFMFDLPSFVLRLLEKEGVQNISPSPADTCQDESRFFSHRRSQDKGRQFSVIVRE